MKLKYVKISFLAFLPALGISAQDKGVFVEPKNGYYQNDIMPGVEKFEKQKVDSKKEEDFKVKIDESKYPTDPSKYTTIWKTDMISQGNTGTCWCFSTTSFYESEVKRISGKEVNLSEMYTVYWQYVERARYFVEHRGDMSLGEGSETNAVALMMQKYGVVPHELFTGMLPGQEFHNHEIMFEEIEDYLKKVKKNNAWNKEEVMNTIKSILTHYMGEIPTEVEVNGKKMTPKEYMNSLGLKPMDYVNFMSLANAPYWQKAEYDVPDNWWNSDDYNNVPLDVFYNAIKVAIKNGYSISIGGDVSEPGFDKQTQVAMIPDFDIPSAQINEFARYMRFENGATTDDHAMHLVGYLEKDGKTWFLIKDSGSGSRNCGEDCEKFGFYFMNEDYIKLKIMSFTIHKDAVKDVLKKMK